MELADLRTLVSVMEAGSITAAAKELNRDRDRVNLWITVLNMAAVPLLVIIFGVVVALRRRSLQAAH